MLRRIRWCAVEMIPQYGVPNPGEVNAYLMRATRERMHAEQCVPGVCVHDAKTCDRIVRGAVVEYFGAWQRPAHVAVSSPHGDVSTLPGDSIAALASRGEREIDLSRSGDGGSVDAQRRVEFPHLLSLQRARQMFLARFAQRHEQRAARALVEPVHEPRLCALVGEVGFDCTPQIRLSAPIAQHRDPGRLVDNRQLGVPVEYLDRLRHLQFACSFAGFTTASHNPSALSRSKAMGQRSGW